MVAAFYSRHTVTRHNQHSLANLRQMHIDRDSLYSLRSNEGVQVLRSPLLMSPLLPAPFSCQSACEQLGRVLRAVLIVWAAWQGPFPWCHAHGTLSDSGTASQQSLRAHLCSHHTAVDPSCDVCFGWHVHYDFPSPGDTSERNGNRPVRTTNAELVNSGLNHFVDSSISVCFAAVASALTCDSLAAQFASASAPQHFFDGFAPDLAPPLRFGILRC